MSLVAYPDSDSDGSAEREAPAVPPSTCSAKAGLKRKRNAPDDAPRTALPPLPAAFHDLYSTNARTSTSDDPNLHGGRKRAIPHVEGNWPTHVFLEWVPSHAESEQLQRLINAVRAALETANKGRAKPLPVPEIVPSLRSPLGAPLPLHVSLSRTLQIKTEGRESFADTLSSSLRRAAVRPFGIQFTSLKWVSNFERNRWFLVLCIERPAHDELNRLLAACNEATERCGHPGLYTGTWGDGPMEPDSTKSTVQQSTKSKQNGEGQLDPEVVDHTDHFHISVAWNLAEPDSEWIALVRSMGIDKHVKAPEAPFDVVKARIGNVVHNIALRSQQSDVVKGGILGLG